MSEEGPYSHQGWKRYHEENDVPYKFTTLIAQQVKLLQCNSVLELGSGYGRNLGALDSDILKVGIENSPESLIQASKRYPRILFLNEDLKTMQRIANFDLVFTCLVLQHFDLNIVDDILKKMIMLSKKYVMCIEAYDKTFAERPIEWHRKMTFNTLNLTPRLERLGLKMVREFPINEEYYFWLAKRL